MSTFFERFLGSTATGEGSLTATPRTGPPAGLQLLLDRPLELTSETVTALLRDSHPDLAEAVAEIVAVSELSGSLDDLIGGEGPPATLLGLVGWKQHVIKLAGFNGMMPPGPLSRTVQHSLMIPPELRDLAMSHQSHLLLDYAGREPDPTERFAAVALVTGVLANFGGIVCLNEEARACVPASALQQDEGEEILTVLRTLPIPYLYGGYVKLELSDPPGAVWYRTFQNPRFGLPNLALAGTHADYTPNFQLFAALTNYLRDTRLELEPGETIRVDEENFFVARNPTDAAWYLDSENGPTIVLERVKATA